MFHQMKMKRDAGLIGSTSRFFDRETESGESVLQWIMFNVKGGAADSKAQALAFNALARVEEEGKVPESVLIAAAQACEIPLVNSGSYKQRLAAHRIVNQVNESETTVLKWLFTQAKAGAGMVRLSALAKFMQENNLPLPKTVSALKQICIRARVPLGASRSEVTVILPDETVKGLLEFLALRVKGNFSRCGAFSVSHWIDASCSGNSVTTKQRIFLSFTNNPTKELSSDGQVHLSDLREIADNLSVLRNGV